MGDIERAPHALPRRFPQPTRAHGCVSQLLGVTAEHPEPNKAVAPPAHGCAQRRHRLRHQGHSPGRVPCRSQNVPPRCPLGH